MARNILIQIRRGLEANIGTLAIGELGYCTDTYKLYIGTTAGNVLLVAAATVGDMLKSIYDTNNDGKVDYASVADSVPWSGVDGKPSTYTPTLGETAATAYRGDRGKIAYDHSQTTHAPSNANYYVHPNSGATAGTYRSVTVDAQGHITAGTNPTTLSGYGITDAASSSHTHSFFSGIADTRAVATVPNDYNSSLRQLFKSNSVIGSPDSSTYSSVLGLRSWTDSSGGYAHELAFTGNGEFYHRSGATTAWGGWGKIIKTTDIATQAEAVAGTDNSKYMTPLRVKQAIAANPLAGGVTWNQLKGV